MEIAEMWPPDDLGQLAVSVEDDTLVFSTRLTDDAYPKSAHYGLVVVAPLYIPPSKALAYRKIDLGQQPPDRFCVFKERIFTASFDSCKAFAIGGDPQWELRVPANPLEVFADPKKAIPIRDACEQVSSRLYHWALACYTTSDMTFLVTEEASSYYTMVGICKEDSTTGLVLERVKHEEGLLPLLPNESTAPGASS